MDIIFATATFRDHLQFTHLLNTARPIKTGYPKRYRVQHTAASHQESHSFFLLIVYIAFHKVTEGIKLTNGLSVSTVLHEPSTLHPED